MSDALRERVNAAVGTLYQVDAEIGRGGMAVVYRAMDTRLRRMVALKVLPPELAFREEVRRRFLREAQMAAQLNHPHIVPIYSVDETSGLVYFVMGLVEGDSLAKLLFLERRPPIPMVRRVLREVADALHYAHAHGVVHRDIKPDNILIESATGRAMVTDFGIARAAEADMRLTATGIAVGTPAYMSPEQAMGEREVDGRADIYALGIVGYQMLAGELPFQAANTPSLLMKHLSEPPRPLLELRPDLPANLAAAIERALYKAPGDRWPDAAAFRDALAENAPVTLSGTAVAARPQEHAPPSYVPPPQAPPAAQQQPLLALGVFRGSLSRSEGDHEIHLWREQRRAFRDQLKAARRELREGDVSSGPEHDAEPRAAPAAQAAQRRAARVTRAAQGGELPGHHRRAVRCQRGHARPRAVVPDSRVLHGRRPPALRGEPVGRRHSAPASSSAAARARRTTRRPVPMSRRAWVCARCRRRAPTRCWRRCRATSSTAAMAG